MRSISMGVAAVMAGAAVSCFVTPGYLVSGFAFTLLFLHAIAETFIPLGREDWEIPSLFQNGLSALLHLLLAAGLYTVTSHESFTSAREAWAFVAAGFAIYGFLELVIFLLHAAAEDMVRKAQEKVEESERELAEAHQHLMDQLAAYLGETEGSGS